MRNPQVTRESLLQAATDLFAREGYSGTTTEMIARRARVNKAMISYHFGGKRKLYLAIVRESLAAGLKQFEEIRGSDQPADARLRAFILAFAEVVRRRPAFPAMIAREAIAGGGNLDLKILPHFLGILAVVREILEQGVRDGIFRPTNPLATHVSLIGTLIFFFSTAAFRARMLRPGGVETIESDDFLRHTQELFVRGLAQPPESTSNPVRS